MVAMKTTTPDSSFYNKEHKTIMHYDGTFNGFLTAIFVAFERKHSAVNFIKNGKSQNELFFNGETIPTHLEKAKRVWNVLHDKNHHALTTIYFAFLSEEPKIENALFRYVKKLMHSGTYEDGQEEQKWMPKINELAALVSREKQRIETFLSFKELDDGMYFSSISPTFNVLPLISKYFRTRYANKQWSIYDEKRKYGLYFNIDHLELVSWRASMQKAV